MNGTALDAEPLEQRALEAGQTIRAGWYGLQYRLALRMIEPVAPPDELKARMPAPRTVIAALREVLRQDRRNVAAGLYPLGAAMTPPDLGMLRTAVAFFRDLPRVQARRQTRDGQEVHRDLPQGRYPRYYRQNFHFQSDGYLSRDSARLYDHQVEVLFGGAADAMRRQALAPLVHEIRQRAMAGSPVANLAFADLACGTGGFLEFLKKTYPRLPSLGLDLSPPYLQEAAERLRGFSWMRLAQGDVEALPLRDGVLDMASSVFLFHELPRKVRRQAAREFARVLRPGGLFVFMDSLQHGDRPKMDGLLDFFPVAYHEPYYADYLDDDLAGLFTEAGFAMERVETHFLSRLMALRRLG